MILFQLPVPPEYQRHHRQAGRRPAEVLLQRGHLPHAGHRHRAGGRGGGHHHVRHHALRAFTLVADDTKFIYLDIQTLVCVDCAPLSHEFPCPGWGPYSIQEIEELCRVGRGSLTARGGLHFAEQLVPPVGAYDISTLHEDEIIGSQKNTSESPFQQKRRAQNPLYFRLSDDLQRIFLCECNVR